MTAPARDSRLFYRTRSLCPTCNELVAAEVIARDGKVVMTRHCETHGGADGLVCSDLAWYEQLPRFMVEPQRPQAGGKERERGCPEDCGLCAHHQQVAGTAAIEISNDCDAQCPVCIADNAQTFRLSIDDVRKAKEAVLSAQQRVDVITLSGGEPTSHPQLFEMLDALTDTAVSHIAINSNGLRIAADASFAQRLARYRNLYICLHHDGRAAERLRGTSWELQERALDHLLAAGVDAVPLILATKGVNDHELGGIVKKLLLTRPNVRSVHLSMMTYAGQGGAHFPHDPLGRLTIPEALDCIEAGSLGQLRRRDFVPLTMPNPMCAAIGFFLVMDGELTPLLPLAELDDVIEYLKGGLFGNAKKQLEFFLKEAINRVYANPGAIDDAEAVAEKLRKLCEVLFPQGAPLSPEERMIRAGRYIKSVYLFQFMDAWTFDTKRLLRCSCQHVLPGGQIVPSCAYYNVHRQNDPRY